MYRQGQLKKTGKNYTFDSAKLNDYDTPYQKRSSAEYTYGGEKYIRIEAKVANEGSILSNGERPEEGKAYWVKVEPVEWLKDRSGTWVSKQAILAGVQFDRKSIYDGDFEKTDMYQRLQELEAQMMPSREYQRQEQRAPEEVVSKNDAPKMTREEKMARRRAKFGVKVEEKEMSVKDQIAFYVKAKQSFMLHGPAGVGKSARIKQIDPDLTPITLCNGMLPEDVVGKTRYKDDGGAVWEAPDWYLSLKKKCEEEPDKNHVLFIDEVTNAKPTVQSLIYHIVLEHSIAENKGKLPDNVVIALAGNEVSDSTAAYDMPAPLIDRMVGHIHLEPNIAEWLEWGAEKSKDNPERLNVHPLISAYVASRGMEVFHQPFDENNPEKLPLTPRGWEMISDVIYANDGVLRQELIANKIGAELAMDLSDFALNPPMGLEDLLEGTYDRDDIPYEADARLALSLSLLQVSEKDVSKVRDFIGSELGKENLAVFDSKWVQGNAERAIQISQLKAREGGYND
ncbi:MAG: AAA family ATPase [Alphaproteobacteria bacterium]|nr:AAA family ATPase [Alphaproteobacteria bacterium]